MLKTAEVSPMNITFLERMETFMGGGVFVAVTKKYVSTTEYSLNTKCEVLWGKITIAGTKPLYEELVSKTSYIHPRHVTHLHYWLPFVIKIVQLSYNMFLLWVTSIWRGEQCLQSDLKWEWVTCRSGQKRFWNKRKFYSFIFLYVCSFCDRVRKQFLQL